MEANRWHSTLSSDRSTTQLKSRRRRLSRTSTLLLLHALTEDDALLPIKFRVGVINDFSTAGGANFTTTSTTSYPTSWNDVDNITNIRLNDEPIGGDGDLFPGYVQDLGDDSFITAYHAGGLFIFQLSAVPANGTPDYTFFTGTVVYKESGSSWPTLDASDDSIFGFLFQHVNAGTVNVVTSAQTVTYDNNAPSSPSRRGRPLVRYLIHGL